MIETLLTEAMHEGTDGVQYDEAVYVAAAGRHHRRKALQLSAVSSVALSAVAVAAVAAIPSGSHHRSAHSLAAPAPTVHTVAFVAKHVKAALAAEDDYVIGSVVTSPRLALTERTWIDPSTGNRKLELDNADGSANTVEGVVVSDGQATITSLDDANHTVSTSTEPADVLDASPRLGVNVESPSDIQSAITTSNLVDKGATRVNGQPVEQYQLLGSRPVGSEIRAKGSDIELYVDPTSYRLVRVTVADKDGLLYSDDLTWTPRSESALATTKVSVPTGFSKR